MSLKYSVIAGNLLMLVAGGCRGYKPDSSPAVQPTEPNREFSLCSGEECNPDTSSLGGVGCDLNSSDPACSPGGNGRGIYNAEGADYCLRFVSSTFCPMGFINRGGKVYVTGVLYAPTGGWSKLERLVTGLYEKKAVNLTSLTAQGAQLRITTVDAKNQTRVFEGDTLAELQLQLTMPGAPESRDDYTLRFTGSPKVLQPNGSSDPSAKLVEYNVQWQGHNALGASSTWTSLCQKPAGEPLFPPLPNRTSFLPGAFFDPFTAKRTPNSNAVTMSCQRGGITKCLEWGYLPWKSAVQKISQQPESLVMAHATCIQMKRAAYCGGESYTTDGTPIYKQHRYDSAQATFVEPPAAWSKMQNLEAVWTPDGAACLNPAHVRVPPAPRKPFAGCKNKQLPLCPPSPGQEGAAFWNLGFTAVGRESAQSP
jgi:hypothetical protein